MKLSKFRCLRDEVRVDEGENRILFFLRRDIRWIRKLEAVCLNEHHHKQVGDVKIT